MGCVHSSSKQMYIWSGAAPSCALVVPCDPLDKRASLMADKSCKAFVSEFDAIVCTTMLADSIGRTFLLQFMEKEMAEENVLFYTAYEELDSLTGIERVIAINSITNKFIALDSEREINISAPLRKKILEICRRGSMNSCSIETLLARANAEVVQIVIGAFPRFVESSMWQAWISAEIEEFISHEAWNTHGLSEPQVPPYGALLIHSHLPYANITMR